MNNKKSLNHWLKELKTSKGHYSYSKWLETKSFSSGSKWYFIPEVGACNKCIENAKTAYDEDPSGSRNEITHYNCKCDIIYTDDPQSAQNMQSLRDYLLKEKDIETNKDFLTNPEEWFENTDNAIKLSKYGNELATEIYNNVKGEKGDIYLNRDYLGGYNYGIAGEGGEESLNSVTYRLIKKA